MDNPNVLKNILEVDGAAIFLRGIGFKINQEKRQIHCPQSDSLIQDVEKGLKVMQKKYHDLLTNELKLEEGLKIMAKNKNKEELTTNTHILVNIIHNIWMNAGVKKFRKLDLSKPKLKALFEFRGAFLVLRSIGFEKVKDKNILICKKENIDKNTIDRALKEFKDFVKDDE
mmetsp:Transcript_39511/g.86062  ORF Transcript_39511/g.86062 Transcript_39511/m.86062 type:complete len:171 (+) Transcript_39511:204-716(+)